jgi:hypothetical protein
MNHEDGIMESQHIWRAALDGESRSRPWQQAARSAGRPITASDSTLPGSPSRVIYFRSLLTVLEACVCGVVVCDVCALGECGRTVAWLDVLTMPRVCVCMALSGRVKVVWDVRRPSMAL